MDKQLVANYLKSLKDKTGLTYGAIAEKSQRSESSVKNLFFANVDDPRVDTIAPVVYAMGGSMDEMLNPDKSKNDLKEASVISIKEMYEFQLATMKETSEEHIHNIRSHYQQHHEDLKENYERRLADKRELIKTLERECLSSKVFSWICILVLVALLIAEVMNPNLGWIKF